MSPAEPKLLINQATREVTYDTYAVTAKYTTPTITVTTTAQVFTPVTTNSDYSVVVNFVPRECKTFVHNKPTLVQMDALDY